MKKLMLIAAVMSIVSMNVFADGPAATGERDTDCQRIVQGTSEGSTQPSSNPVPSTEASGTTPTRQQ